MKKILLILLINIFFINKSFALIEVDITRGNLDPLPIAISPLHVDVKSNEYEGIKIKELGENISKIIEDNFRATGLFNPLKKDAFVQKPDIAHLKPRFEDWKVIKAQHLVAGKISGSNGKISVEFRLYDVFQQKQLVGRKYETNEKNSIKTTHQVLFVGRQINSSCGLKTKASSSAYMIS